ncbi:MAG: major facilitator superfamily 1, partial [Marmoricola sp.]|nr:major facilitator superfamily 1 [Marmoricola sp.]
MDGRVRGRGRSSTTGEARGAGPGDDEPVSDLEPRRPWLSRNLKIVSLVSLLQDAASELLYPIMPILLTTVLGAPAAVVGAIEGIAEGVAAVTKVLAGRFSDRWRKVPLVGLGYGLAAVGKVIIALAGAWPVVLAGRVVDRLGKGVRGAPRDALLVVGIPPEQRGRAFGFHRTADTAGAVIGPLIGLAGYELLDHDLRPLLWLAVVPAVLSALLVYALKEPGREGGGAGFRRRAPERPAQPSVAERPAQPSERDGGVGPGLDDGPGGPARPTGAGGGTARPAGSGGGPARPTYAPVPHPPLGRPFWSVVGVLGVFSLVNFPDALLLLRLHDIGFSTPQVILA